MEEKTGSFSNKKLGYKVGGQIYIEEHVPFKIIGTGGALPLAKRRSNQDYINT